jgi:hypothetical protein
MDAMQGRLYYRRLGIGSTGGWGADNKNKNDRRLRERCYSDRSQGGLQTWLTQQ